MKLGSSSVYKMFDVCREKVGSSNDGNPVNRVANRSLSLYINENSLVGEFGDVESSYTTMFYFHCCDYTMTHTTYTKSVNLGTQIQNLCVQDGRITSMSKITEVFTQNGKHKT